MKRLFVLSLFVLHGIVGGVCGMPMARAAEVPPVQEHMSPESVHGHATHDCNDCSHAESPKPPACDGHCYAPDERAQLSVAPATTPAPVAAIPTVSALLTETPGTLLAATRTDEPPGTAVPWGTMVMLR